MSDFPVTIFHNPACGTSRNALAMIRAAGYQPEVVEYLQAGWTTPQLKDLLARMGLRPRDLLRESGVPAEALARALAVSAEDDEGLLAAMVDHPILVNRPIVATPLGVRLCRPSETLLELLDSSFPGFVKEDGQIVRGPAADLTPRT
jgi:arsenate reductase (glutaredoxin)